MLGLAFSSGFFIFKDTSPFVQKGVGKSADLVRLFLFRGYFSLASGPHCGLPELFYIRKLNSTWMANCA